MASATQRTRRSAGVRVGRSTPIGRRRALAEIERFRDDPDGLTDKIDAEIDEFK